MRPFPIESNKIAGPRRTLAASSTIKSATPQSSAITPTLLIRARSRTPIELITVETAISTQPSKHGVRGGARRDRRDHRSTETPARSGEASPARARATAARLMTEPQRYTQPAIQPIDRELSLRDHW